MSLSSLQRCVGVYHIVQRAQLSALYGLMMQFQGGSDPMRPPVVCAVRINPDLVCLAFVFAGSRAQRALLPVDSLRNPHITDNVSSSAQRGPGSVESTPACAHLVRGLRGDRRGRWVDSVLQAVQFASH